MAIEKQINIVVKETGIDSVNKKVSQLDTSLEGLQTTQKGVAKSMGESSNSILENGGAMGLLNDATGGLAMTVKDAVEATALFAKNSKIAAMGQALYATVVGTSTGAMKLFRLALISTGIGAIVVGLGLLIANFDKVQKYVQVAIDKFNGMGQGAKLLISLMFPIVGVIRLIVAGLEKMGVIDDAVTAKAKKNAEARIKYLDNQKTKITESYDSEIRLAKAAEKDTVALEEAKRKAILKTLYALNEAERARIKSGEATEDDVKKWNERQKEINKIIEDGKVAEIEAETERRNKRKEAADKIKEENKVASQKRKDEKAKLIEEEIQKVKDLAKAKADAEMQSAKDALAIQNDLLQSQETPAQKEEREYQDRKEVLEKNYLSTELLETDHKAKLKKIDEDYWSAEADASIARTAKEKKDTDDKKALEQSLGDAKVNIAMQTMDLISEIAGKGSKVGKALAIAQATINGIQGVQNAFTTASASPITTLFPAYPFIQAGLAGVFSLLQIKKIASTDPSGKSGGGGGASSGGGSGPTAPSFNLVAGTGSNQIAEGIAGQRQPLQAYVVSGAVTNAQQMQRNIVEGASL
jgi:hypothetical protein